MLQLYKNIKKLREEYGWSQEDLARKIGYTSRTSIAKIEAGKIDLPQSKIKAFADALHTTPSYLMGWTDEPQTEITADNLFRIETKKFPLLGNIACGEPIFADENFETYVEARADIQADFCLQAQGDSMIGARIQDGDIVFIHKQETVENGEIAAVLIEDEATLKRVHYDQENQILQLFAENPRYKTMRFAGEELNEIRILGKAIAFQSNIK